MSTGRKTFMHRSGDIDWYCEQSGQGRDVVLIPSGEGDCSAFGKVAEDLAQTFRVTTFDTPGYSRSSAPANLDDISTATLGAQVAALLTSLGIRSATVYGCSSGGLATLDLVVHHRDLVRHAVVHEVALAASGKARLPPFLMAATKMDDSGIVASMSDLYANVLNEDAQLWKALGDDYHARLEKNYVTWIRRYVDGKPHPPVDPAALTGLPIIWTIGGLSLVVAVFDNIQTSHRAGIELGMLPSRHFPQVSIPDKLAAHIREVAVRPS